MKKYLFLFLLCVFVQRTFAQTWVTIANGQTSASGTIAPLSFSNNSGTFTMNTNLGVSSGTNVLLQMVNGTVYSSGTPAPISATKNGDGSYSLNLINTGSVSPPIVTGSGAITNSGTGTFTWSNNGLTIGSGTSSFTLQGSGTSTFPVSGGTSSFAGWLSGTAGFVTNASNNQTGQAIVFEGNSETTGFGLTSGSQYATVFQSLSFFKNRGTIQNTAVNASKLADVMGRYPTDRAYRPGQAGITQAWYSAFVGTNDWANIPWSTSSDVTAYIANLTALDGSAHADGFKVINWTIIRRQDAAGLAANEALRQQANTAIRGMAGVYDILIDADEDFPDATNLTWWQSGSLHLNNSANAYLATDINTRVMTEKVSNPGGAHINTGNNFVGNQNITGTFSTTASGTIGGNLTINGTSISNGVNSGTYAITGGAITASGVTTSAGVTTSGSIDFGTSFLAESMLLYNSGTAVHYGWGIGTHQQVFYVDGAAVSPNSQFSFDTRSAAGAFATIAYIDKLGNANFNGSVTTTSVAASGTLGAVGATITGATNLATLSVSGTLGSLLSFGTIFLPKQIKIYDDGSSGAYGIGMAGHTMMLYCGQDNALSQIGFANCTGSTITQVGFIDRNGNISLNGTNCLLASQSLTGAGSILTEGLGDTRYVAVTGTGSAVITFGLQTLGATTSGTVAVSGANVGDRVDLGLPSTTPNGVAFTAFVSTSGTVLINTMGLTTVTVNSGTYNVTTHK